MATPIHNCHDHNYFHHFCEQMLASRVGHKSAYNLYSHVILCDTVPTILHCHCLRDYLHHQWQRLPTQFHLCCAYIRYIFVTLDSTFANVAPCHDVITLL